MKATNKIGYDSRVKYDTDIQLVSKKKINLTHINPMTRAMTFHFHMSIEFGMI